MHNAKICFSKILWLHVHVDTNPHSKYTRSYYTNTGRVIVVIILQCISVSVGATRTMQINVFIVNLWS